MSCYRRLIITLGLVVLLVLTFGAAAAKGNDTPKPPRDGQGSNTRGKPARLTWTPTRITQAVTAGQTIQLTATFTSSADIAEATLVISGGLGRVLKADPAKLSTIKADTPTTVTFSVTMPTQGAHTQGGVVRVQAGKRTLAQPLPVLLTVANGDDTGQNEDDTPKPAKPTKPAKPAKP